MVATDPVSGLTSAQKVTAVHRNLDAEFADVTVAEPDGGRAVVRTTSDHPFWNETAGGWTDAGELVAGDTLLARAGVATVADVRRHTGAEVMYDLTVADLHTFYAVAGSTPVLVHNCITIEKLPDEIKIEHSDGGLGQATLDENGLLDLSIGTRWETDGVEVRSELRGGFIFETVMDHFGDRVRAIGGHWVFGDNLAKFNKLKDEGLSDEAAAAGTWTGGQAAIYGFTRVARVVKNGEPGNWTYVDVVFERG